MTSNFFKANIKKIALIFIQTIILLVVGLISKDVWFSIIVSLIGVVFNVLVSLKVGVGFLFGFAYAILNGIMAYSSKVYATFAFMIFIQAPMAIYSFLSWRKNKTSEGAKLKSLSKKQSCILLAFVIALSVTVYFILSTFQKSNLVLDTIFFVFSVAACFLLALRYKAAFIFMFLSGLGGTGLWIYQMVTVKSGLSIAVFFGMVSINGFIALYNNYLSKQSRNITK